MAKILNKFLEMKNDKKETEIYQGPQLSYGDDGEIVAYIPEKKKCISIVEKGGKGNIYSMRNKLIQVPNINKEREVIYIFGPSGSGKSYYLSKYLGNYRKIYPENNVVLFSEKEYDECIDKHGPIRIPIDEELLEEEIGIDEFENGLIIFDDIDAVSEKEYKKYLYDLIGKVLKLGRAKKISVIITHHIGTDYNNTRSILNESMYYTFFPKGGGTYHIKNILKQYIGLDKKSISRILKLPSRWITIHKQYPQYCIYENGIFMI